MFKSSLLWQKVSVWGKFFNDTVTLPSPGNPFFDANILHLSLTLYSNQFSDSLNDAFLNKDTTAFWNTWCSKMGRNKSSPMVDEQCEEKNIADWFTTVFTATYVPIRMYCIIYLVKARSSL